MQVVDWDRKPVDADKERHPNNMNANEMMLVKLYSSEERCCIIIVFLQSRPSCSMQAFDLELPLRALSDGHLAHQCFR